MLLSLILWSGFAFAEGCPNADDEPAMTVKTKAGPKLSVCGFEDHEVKAEGGRRAFSEFTVYAVIGTATPAKVFASEGGDTHWIRAGAKSALEIEELWFFADKPHPAIARQVTCDAKACAVQSTRCVLNLKKNLFPKSLATLERRLKSKKPVGEDGEDLLDEVWAQALNGDKKARAFYSGEPPPELDATLVEVFLGNRIKLRQAEELKCASLK